MTRSPLLLLLLAVGLVATSSAPASAQEEAEDEEHEPHADGTDEDEADEGLEPWGDEDDEVEDAPAHEHEGDEPAHGHEEPSHGHEEPAHGHEEPSHGHEEPAHGHEEPAHGHGEPAHGHEEPAHEHEEEDEEDLDGDGDDEEEDAEGELGGTTTSWVPDEDPEDEDDSTLIIPPLFMRRTRGDTTTTAVFPLYFEQSSPDDVQRLILLYYNRRSLEENADVLFPLYWSFRGVDSLTFSIPPVYYHYDDDGFDWAIAPLIFDGRSADSVYTIIPPLLTFSWADDDAAYTQSLIYWRRREAEAVKWGIFPLLWDMNDEIDRTTIVAPIFFRFSDHETENVLTVVPPVYHEEDPSHAFFGVLPLFHHYHDDEGASLTLPPLLFHYGNFNGDVRLFNPFFLWFDVDDEETLISWLYQRHRGQTEFDAVAPFVFSYRDPREGYSSLIIPPLVWSFSGPASTNHLVFPFFGYFHEPGLYSTWATLLAVHNERHDEDSGFTWVFPTLQLNHDPETTVANFHPLVYSKDSPDYRHLVVAPIHWDFEWRDEDYRVTVDFPLFWRFRSGAEVKQVFLNTYYREYEEDGANGWEFHFFPLFAFGKSRRGDHFWNILYGLVGYRRQGSYARTQLFWIPFQTDGPDQ